MVKNNIIPLKGRGLGNSESLIVLQNCKWREVATFGVSIEVKKKTVKLCRRDESKIEINDLFWVDSDRSEGPGPCFKSECLKSELKEILYTSDISSSGFGLP